MAKKKYYVVWQGVEPGIYDDWTSCKRQVDNFPAARYKSYPTKEEAEAAYRHGPESSPKKKKPTRPNYAQADIQIPSWSVDAACSGNPGKMEYQGVFTADKSQIFYAGPFAHGTNNVGEFLAIVHALALLKNIGDERMPIYSDSRTAMTWIRNKFAKTNLKETKANKELLQHVLRAEAWLKENTYKNPILKWETKSWGEIPADFGRK